LEYALPAHRAQNVPRPFPTVSEARVRRQHHRSFVQSLREDERFDPFRFERKRSLDVCDRAQSVTLRTAGLDRRHAPGIVRRT
jgi:hypothetical protein